MTQSSLLDDLRRAIEHSSLPIVAVAKRAGLPTNVVRAILDDESDPALSTVVRLVKALDLELVLRESIESDKPPSTELLSVHSRVRRLLEPK